MSPVQLELVIMAVSHYVLIDEMWNLRLMLSSLLKDQCVRF